MRHSIITIYDLKHLTDMELEILDKTLRNVLTSRGMTEIERANIYISLLAIVVEINYRLSLLSDWTQQYQKFNTTEIIQALPKVF